MIKTVLLLKVACILLLPAVTVADVVLYPGYIQGTVTTGDFNVYNASVSASGGGYSSSKSTAGNTYSLTVQGGPWEYYVNTTAYVRSTTSNYPYTRMYFSPRYMTVPESVMVQNDYNFSNPGVIQFQINITGDAYTSWYTRGYAYNSYVAGQERTNSNGYTNSSSTPDGVWEMPVVPNTGVRVYAYVYVDGKRYDFETGYPYYYEDIAAGETVVVPIDIVHDATPNPGYEYGTIQGNIDLTGVDGFNRHRVYANGDNQYLYTNPGNYLLDTVRTGLTDVRAYSWFDNYQSYLQWPYIDGDYQNNRIDVVVGGNYTLDLIENAGTLTGDVTFTGTMTNADLNYFQLNVYPADRIYKPSTGWVYQTTNGGYASQTKYSSDTYPSAYRLFLTPGPWRPYYLYADSYNYDSGYYMRSYHYIQDFNYYYDGSSYNFGQNVDVAPGATTVHDREYCTGSLLVRFRDASGGLLRNPRLDGNTNIYEDGKRTFYVRTYGYSSTPYMAEPEVEVHGYPATYPFYARAYTEDNSYVTFARFNESLECGIRKGRDFDGPNLIVQTPPAGDITNAQTVAVSGTATDDAGVASITLNGVNVPFISTGNPDDTNEVSYTYNLPVVNGENTITVVALDANNNESSNAREIYVDRWLPTVMITSPGNGAVSGPSANISIEVEGTDQGYGYDLTVTLDGAVIHEASGLHDDSAPSTVTYNENRTLGLGAHTITAVTSDKAGNSSSATVTVWVNDPPVLAIDLHTQTVQYGDKISTITITADDSDTPPSELEVSWSQLPNALAPTGGCSASGEGSSCTWELGGQILEMAGSYEISLTVDDGVDPRSTGTEVIVVQEEATAAFDDVNPSSVRVVSDGGDSGEFDLIVHVSEAQPDLPVGLAAVGDISLADVTINLVPMGPGGAEEPTSCTPTSASGSVTCRFSGISVETYTVEVTMSGNYYTGSAENVLTVYDPSLGFTTGGGWFNWPGTGEKTNFGYTMKYGKNSSNVKGSLLLIRHLPDGQKYRIKSNNLDGLAIGQDLEVPYGWASFSGRATYLEPGMLEAEGNHGFTVYVEDRNEPGRGNDRIWITTRAKDGNEIPAISLEESAPDNAVTIGGGNIVAPH